MKRTLAISLLLGFAAGATAQTPKLVEKPVVQVASTAKVSAQKTAAGAKVNPAKLKVVAVPVTKHAVVKPAVVAAQPHAMKTPGEQRPHAVTAPKKPTVAVTHPAPKVTGGHASVAIAETHKNSKAPLKKPVTVIAAHEAKNPFHASPKTVAVKSNSGHVSGKEVEHKKSAPAKVSVAETKPEPSEKKEPIKVGAAGRRDPFVSPVVNMAAVGSGCSSGKRCLAIDQVALRGIVKSETGMIAVVVNSMDKAYFLRENDPVFNGYVVKITENSIVFKETFRDRLGKPLTRDVTKTINRPVA